MPAEGDYEYTRYFTKRERKTRRAQAVKAYLRQGWPLEKARERAKKDCG